MHKDIDRCNASATVLPAAHTRLLSELTSYYAKRVVAPANLYMPMFNGISEDRWHGWL